MQYLTLATTLLTTLNFATAAPTLIPRTCPTQYPSSIGFPINYTISQSAGAVDKVDATISFLIPANSYGCTLRSDIPAGYPITSTGNSQVYVFDGNNAQVGTITFGSPQSEVINSFVCEPQMEYRLSIGSLEEAGSVAFSEILGAGLTMTYDC